MRAATLVFGLFHGFGLSTKIIEYQISPDGLVPNLLAFNVGVEIGQLLALAAILMVCRRPCPCLRCLISNTAQANTAVFIRCFAVST